jgi:hypothetical protein
LIYRVVGESSEWVWSEESGALEVSLGPGRLMGAFNAGIADEAWGDLPMPMLSNPRVRFWFTGSSQWPRLPCHPAQESVQVNSGIPRRLAGRAAT